MTATNHALTGAMIATAIKQPLLTLPLAFASHFICDALPHFGIDMKFGSRAMYTWLVTDGIAMFGCAAVLLALGVNNPILLAIAGFVAMAPDLAWLHYGLKGKLHDANDLDALSRFHTRIQWYQKVRGIGVEFVWAAFMIFAILKLQ